MMNEEIKKIECEIREKKKTGNTFTMNDIDKYADKIRKIMVGKNERDPISVLKTAEEFGFSVLCSDSMTKEYPGDIHIKDEICKMFGKEKIIFVDKDDIVPQRRFVTIHELGHYLFDYIGSEVEINSKPYSCPYAKDSHNDDRERVANRFAASLLTPKELFIKKHDEAVDRDSRRIYVIKYLAYVFQVTESSVEKRIMEVSEE